MKHSLSDDQLNEFDVIVKPIYKEGKLDFSKKEKVSYTVISGIAMYFAWESAKFFLDTGGRGTHYLPLGHFSKEFGGQAAFWSNATLNWFFIMDTLITARNAYYQYQLAKKLDIPVSLKKSVTKLTIALAFAVVAGSVMAIIDSVGHSFYNAMVTGGVNIVLSYIGSIALEVLFVGAFYYCKEKLSSWYCPKVATNKILSSLSARWVADHLSTRTEAIQALSTDDCQWSQLTTSLGYQNFVLAPNQTSALLTGTNHQESNKLENTLSILFHAIMQLFDKIALYGYYRGTVASLKIKNSSSRHAIGSLIFIPFASLSFKVVWDTSNDIIHLTKAMITNISEFVRNPNWSKETFIKLAFILPATALALFSYFIAYISANTSLALNADYGWNDWWNVYPTAIGAATFNGFGFLSILMLATTKLMEYALYSPEKRDVLHKHAQVCRFFQNYPEAIDQLENNFSVNLRPMKLSLSI